MDRKSKYMYIFIYIYTYISSENLDTTIARVSYLKWRQAMILCDPDDSPFSDLVCKYVSLGLAGMQATLFCFQPGLFLLRQ